MAIQFKDGQILFVGGQIAMDEDCCCDGGEPTTCPTDCSSCATSITVTISGNAFCNGTFTLDKSGCQWSLASQCATGFELVLLCASEGWQVRIIDTNESAIATVWLAISFAACPPTGSYVLQAGSGTCSVS